MATFPNFRHGRPAHTSQKQRKTRQKRASLINGRFATSAKQNKNNQKQAQATKDEKPHNLTASINYNNNNNNNYYFIN